jgi:Ca2+-binding RTX toxin-like protein
MADENVRTGTIHDDEDPQVDQLTADPNSAFPDDEELNEQLPNEAEGDDRTALTAAHQGSRATSIPSDSAAAFDPADQPDLFGDTPERASASSNTASRSSGDVLLGNPGVDIIANLNPDLFQADDNSAQGASENGDRGAATAAERNVGDAASETASGTAGVSAIDGLPLNGGGPEQGNPGAPASNGAANQGSSPDTDPSAEFGANSNRNDDGLGGSGDESGSAGTGAADDGPVEYVEETESADDGGGGNGVNPIIGDKFDNNLVGTDGRDMINAKDGDDMASGGAGNDLIMGKKGDDTLEGGLGDDRMEGGHGDDTFLFSDADFNGNAWTDTVDGQGTPGKAPISDYDTIDLTNVSQGWTLEVDGAGAGAEATELSMPSEYAQGGAEFSGTITFDDGSTIAFDNIEKVDW